MHCTQVRADSVFTATPPAASATHPIFWSELYLQVTGFYGLAVSKVGFPIALVALIFSACSNGQRRTADPPLHATSQGSSLPSASTDVSSARAQATSSGRASGEPDSAAPRASSSTGLPGPPTAGVQEQSRDHATSSSNVAPVPKLLDSGGQVLPQTEEEPSFESPSFQRRIRLLFDAIVKDDPRIATPSFFPVVAYEQVKAISQPARDHKQRLLAAFSKNIHQYHRQVAKLSEPKLVGVVPSTLAARWMKPGTEGNKLGYHRLLRSKLKVTDSAGKELFLEITSMISWRGEWYVVHLDGFK